MPKRWPTLPTLIIELKWNKTAAGATTHIKNRIYPAALKDFDQNILLIELNYDEKTKTHSCNIEEL